MRIPPTAVLLLGISLCSVNFAAGLDFSKIDKDGDGVITQVEFKAAGLEGAKAAGKATVSETEAPEPPTPPSPPKKSKVFEWVDNVFDIRESFFTPEASLNPAKISWTKPTDGDSFYHLDLAVQLKTLN